MSRPLFLRLAAPIFVIYLLGGVWLLLVASGFVTYVDAGGQAMAPSVAILAALASALISLTAWAVYKAKPWSRPLLMWLPVPLAVITAGLAYWSGVSVGGVLLQHAPSYLVWIALLYWYLYRKGNVVAYFEGAD